MRGSNGLSIEFATCRICVILFLGLQSTVATQSCSCSFLVISLYLQYRHGSPKVLEQAEVILAEDSHFGPFGDSHDSVRT